MLRSKSNPWMCAAAVTTLALASSAGALIVHDTLDGHAGTHTVGYATGPLHPGQAPFVNQPAQSFNVPGETVTLDTLTVNLLASREYTLETTPDQLIPTGNDGDDYVVRLWDNDTDHPGNLLESLTVANSGSLSNDHQNPSSVTLNSITHPQLTVGETYWVSVAIPEVNSTYSHGAWRFSDTLDTGRAVAFSNSASTSWHVNSNPNNVMSFQVTGSPIPEPAALTLMGLAGLTLLRRRA